MSNDLYLHVVKQDLASVEDLKQGFLGIAGSKYFDLDASIETVQKGQTLISKMPSYWICSMDVPAAERVANLIGEDFPTLSTMLRDRLLETLTQDRVPYHQVRPDSRGLQSFFDLYLNFQCFTYVW